MLLLRDFWSSAELLLRWWGVGSEEEGRVTGDDSKASVPAELETWVLLFPPVVLLRVFLVEVV